MSLQFPPLFPPVIPLSRKLWPLFEPAAVCGETCHFLPCNLSTHEATHASFRRCLWLVQVYSESTAFYLLTSAHMRLLVIQNSLHPQTTARPREASNQAIVSGIRQRDPIISLIFASNNRNKQKNNVLAQIEGRAHEEVAKSHVADQSSLKEEVFCAVFCMCIFWPRFDGVNVAGVILITGWTNRFSLLFVSHCHLDKTEISCCRYFLQHQQ